MASYIVLSFDADSSSSIRIHALTCDRERASETYEAVLALRGDELVEMLRLSDEFKCVDGADVFWGNHAPGHGAPEKGVLRDPVEQPALCDRCRGPIPARCHSMSSVSRPRASRLCNFTELPDQDDLAFVSRIVTCPEVHFLAHGAQHSVGGVPVAEEVGVCALIGHRGGR
jgi:hypothetical protein